MTICIGAICENGKNVIMAADRMWTETATLWYEFEPTERKLEEISNNCLAAMAGSVVAPDRLFKGLNAYVRQKNLINIETIANIAKEIYREERNKQIEDLYFKIRGMSLREFYGDGVRTPKIATLPEPLAKALDGVVSNFDFDLELLIAGIDEKGGHLYHIFNPGISRCMDRIGFLSIGTGERHADIVFIQNDYRPNKSLEEALYIVYSAKRSAENAPGVGKKTDIAIVGEGKITYIMDNDPLMKELNTIYEKRKALHQKARDETKPLIDDLRKFFKQMDD